MLKGLNVKRLAAAGLAVVLSIALSACFVLPGKFAETLDIRKDGTFTYTYKGEVVVMGLTKLMDMVNASKGVSDEFTPSPCYSTKTGRERPCTKAELAKQKADWDEGAEARAAEAKQKDKAMAAMMGGLDPNDPKSGEELAVRLRKQAGFKSVTYKGDGVYDIDFQITAKLDHDFSFPTIERLPMILPFLTVNLRNDGSVRISSPIMDQTNGGGANAMGMGAFGAVLAADEAGKNQDATTGEANTGDPKPEGGMTDAGAAPPFPMMDGTFTLTTDATILANNTEDGPKADPKGKRIEWKLNIRNSTPPMALVQLGQ